MENSPQNFRGYTDTFTVCVRGLTVEPSRVVLCSSQVRGVTHHAVDGGVACRQVGHCRRVQVAL